MSSQSLALDFQRTPTFFTNFNNKFHLTNMSASVTNQYEFVFAKYCPTNIQECLSGDRLNDSMVYTEHTANVSLVWDEANEIIKTSNRVEWNIGNDHTTMQGVFLRDKSSQFIMGYSINLTPVDVTDKVIIDANTILWSFIDGN